MCAWPIPKGGKYVLVAVVAETKKVYLEQFNI